MSSQTFGYVDDVPAALAELFRVLKPGGRVLIHDTDWGTILWRSSDRGRMARIMRTLQGAFADPHLPQILGERLAATGFADVRAEPFVQLEIDYDPTSVSAVLTEGISGYVTSNGIPQNEADAWARDLHEHASRGEYFFSSTEYIFTGIRP
jgi:SAM-dependent methyltransferase